MLHVETLLRVSVISRVRHCCHLCLFALQQFQTFPESSFRENLPSPINVTVSEIKK